MQDVTQNEPDLRRKRLVLPEDKLRHAGFRCRSLNHLKPASSAEVAAEFGKPVTVLSCVVALEPPGLMRVP